jgi:hypothetical protein
MIRILHELRRLIVVMAAAVEYQCHQTDSDREGKKNSKRQCHKSGRRNHRTRGQRPPNTGDPDRSYQQRAKYQNHSPPTQGQLGQDSRGSVPQQHFSEHQCPRGRHSRCAMATLLVLDAPFHPTLGRSGSYQCMSARLSIPRLVRRRCRGFYPQMSGQVFWIGNVHSGAGSFGSPDRKKGLAEPQPATTCGAMVGAGYGPVRGGAGTRIAKTTPCKGEWTPARGAITALSSGAGEEKGPNLISSRSSAAPGARCCSHVQRRSKL